MKLSTPKNSPKVKKKKGKEKPEKPEEKTARQLRGFWTTFAQNQKRKKENPESLENCENKKSDCASAPGAVSMPVQAYTAGDIADTCPEQTTGRGLLADKSESNANSNCCKDLTGN